MSPENDAAPGVGTGGGQKIEQATQIDINGSDAVKAIDWSAVHRCATSECSGGRSRWCPWECVEADQ